MAREPNPLPADQERNCYLEGIALFNQRRYFDAHEAWEEVWKRSTGNHKLFYQGLIQCAVALEHMKARQRTRRAKPPPQTPQEVRRPCRESTWASTSGPSWKPPRGPSHR